MSLRFYCSNCQQRLSVSSRKRGQEVKCPRCHRVVVVPDRDPEQSETAAGSSKSEGDERAFPPLASTSELVYADRAAPEAPSRAGGEQTVTLPRYVVYTQGLLLCAVALAFFVFGLIIGTRSQRNLERTDHQNAIVVSGTVVYEDANGAEMPDAGSVILLLPALRQPDEKNSAVGLRSEDPEPEADHPALVQLRRIGGDYARTDRRGRYRVRAPDSGRYYLLVISKQTDRPRSDNPQPGEIAKLGRFFTPASELLGKRRYRWKEILLRENLRYNVKFPRK